MTTTPAIGDQRAYDVALAQPLAQKGNGQKRQGDGPGLVYGLGLLGGKQVICFEQDEVVEKRVQRAQAQGKQVLPFVAGKQKRKPAACGQDGREHEDGGQGGIKQELGRVHMAQGKLEGGGHGGPQDQGAEPVDVGLFLVHHRGASGKTGKPLYTMPERPDQEPERECMAISVNKMRPARPATI